MKNKMLILFCTIAFSANCNQSLIYKYKLSYYTKINNATFKTDSKSIENIIKNRIGENCNFKQINDSELVISINLIDTTCFLDKEAYYGTAIWKHGYFYINKMCEPDTITKIFDTVNKYFNNQNVFEKNFVAAGANIAILLENEKPFLDLIYSDKFQYILKNNLKNKYKILIDFGSSFVARDSLQEDKKNIKIPIPIKRVYFVNNDNLFSNEDILDVKINNINDSTQTCLVLFKKGSQKKLLEYYKNNKEIFIAIIVDSFVYNSFCIGDSSGGIELKRLNKNGVGLYQKILKNGILKTRIKLIRDSLTVN